MRSDSAVLPDLREARVLHDLGLIRTDELPALAARWLADDVVDTDSVRMLAGHNAHDPWGLERLLAAAVAEASIDVAADTAERQHIAVDWVTSNWQLDHDTRRAVRTLARLDEANPDFDLGLFVGFDDEWGAGWGRVEADLTAEAEREIEHFLHGQR